MTYGDSRLAEGMAQELASIMDEKAAALASGAAQDFAAYRYECGIIEGMRIALFTLESVKKKLESPARDS